MRDQVTPAPTCSHARASRSRPAGEGRSIATGVAVAIPPGYAGFVQPRSGLALRHGVTCLNTPGLIDSGYRDELRVMLVNTDPHVAYEVQRGDRIAQLVIQRVEEADFVEVDRSRSFPKALGDWAASVTPGGDVERLSGLDAGFLAMETDRMHMHVCAVMVFEPSDATVADTPAAHFDRLRQVVQERLHLVPLMRRRVVRVPFGLHHPMWVEDPNFDLDYHLRRASLPAPGGPRELAEFVADMSGRPFDPNRPLWEMHMVEGLESGHIAVVSKMHHAAMDGASGADTIATFLDVGPEPRLVTPPPRPWRSEPLPSEAELIAMALSSLDPATGEGGGHRAEHLGRASPVWRERNRRMREEDDANPPPALFSAPRTSLNGVISSQRRFGFLQAQLDELRTVKQTFGGTINDVVLAAVAGALRRLMDERGEDLDESLVAMVPMSLRTEEDRGTHGNKLSAMLVSLATRLPTPSNAWRWWPASSRLAKEQSGVLSGDLMQKWAQMALPAFSSRVARVAGNLRVFDHVRPLFNVVVSNVPGPEYPPVVRGGPLGGVVPGRPHHRRGGAQHHRVQLPGVDVLRDSRVPGARARGRPSGRAALRFAGRTGESCRSYRQSLGMIGRVVATRTWLSW